jgi:hypothetical protein
LTCQNRIKTILALLIGGLTSRVNPESKQKSQSGFDMPKQDKNHTGSLDRRIDKQGQSGD